MRIETFTVIPGLQTLQQLMILHEVIFSSSKGFLDELTTKHRPHILLAFREETMVGYKIGYERKRNYFYSWLGGVHPEYRGQGIAKQLLKGQHDWCRENDYETIRTHTKNKWRSMLILNIKNGFDVIGTTFSDGKGELKIILEKQLKGTD